MGHHHGSPGYWKRELAAGHHTMKTLKEIIEALRCRKGQAVGTTKLGAYWLAVPPIKIRSYGGDGIGNNGARVEHLLELRCYRSGEVKATIHVDAQHQNGSHGGAGDWWSDCSDILSSATVEEAIVALKCVTVDSGANAYSDGFKDRLTEALTALGMPLSAPPPDDE